MALDQNEKIFIEKLVAALRLLDAGEEDLQTIMNVKKIDKNFLKKASKIFNGTEACDVCRHAFYSWRHTVDDETIFSFIDDWIAWKEGNNTKPQARVVKMKKD